MSPDRTVRQLDGDVRLPAKSAIHAVLHRHGLVKPIGRARSSPLAQDVRIPAECPG